jgi:DNA-binding NtrC family response regulator
LPSSCVPSSLVPLLSSVLILAREEVVAALLGLMVELRGLQPRFLGREESVEDAIARGPLVAVVIDCDHPDCSESLLQAIRNAGAQPILFSPFRMQSEVKEVAARHGTRSFTLPTDPDTFGRMLEV